mmetsp:Transcript_24404/g.18542  ORF Transcript_24404/g.18542 Transcript_24404/m.18542 type:complete len:340 (-) Transcript_24404:187-1206(-)
MEFAQLVIPQYPVGTPGEESKQGNYFHKLSGANQAALDSVQRWVADNNINCADLNPYALDHRLTMLRYLRANNFDVNKATKHMSDNIAWRAHHKVSELVHQRPDDILGFKIEDLTKVFPHWHYGFDKTGRPVVYKQYGKFDATRIKAMAGGNFDSLIRYHIWEQEAAGRLFRDQTLSRGELVETLTGVIDVKDMSMFQITSDFLAMVKLLAEVDQKQYPETMGRVFIINVPSVFPLVWRGIRPWLDPITAAKIVVLGGKRDYEPIFADFIGKENLPANYGGDLPPLSMEIHPYAHSLAMMDSTSTVAESVSVGKEFADEEKKLDMAELNDVVAHLAVDA